MPPAKPKNDETLLENVGKDAAAGQPELLSRLSAIEAELAKERKTREAAEAEAARLREEADAVRDRGGLKFRSDAKAYAPAGASYEFRVTPIIPSDKAERYAHLKPVTVQAVDEAEAKRYYFESNEEKPGTGRSLDTLAVRLEVVEVGNKRQLSLIRDKQISALRAKVNAGAFLSDKDKELLAECEDEIFGTA